jgi:hypothetical protein
VQDTLTTEPQPWIQVLAAVCHPDSAAEAAGFRSLTMPVLDAVQTFAGIANENEFYSHHYLAEVFKGDIKARLEAWEANEALAPAALRRAAPRAPQAPASLGASGLPARPGRPRGHATTPSAGSSSPSCRPACCRRWATAHRQAAHPVARLVPGQPAAPVATTWQVAKRAAGPRSWPSSRPTSPARRRRPARPQAAEPALRRRARAPLRCRRNLGRPCCPKRCSAPTSRRATSFWSAWEWLLLDRYKWPNNRAAALRLGEILDRKETDTLQACAALLHHDSLAPNQGASLLEAWMKTPTSTPSASAKTSSTRCAKPSSCSATKPRANCAKRRSASKKGFYTGKDRSMPAT